MLTACNLGFKGTFTLAVFSLDIWTFQNSNNSRKSRQNTASVNVPWQVDSPVLESDPVEQSILLKVVWQVDTTDLESGLGLGPLDSIHTKQFDIWNLLAAKNSIKKPLPEIQIGISLTHLNENSEWGFVPRDRTFRLETYFTDHENA